MNSLIPWWSTTVVAILASLSQSLAAALPHQPVSEHVYQHPARRHGGFDFLPSGDQWSSVIADSRNFPLQDNNDVSPFQDNDRSIYDPGVVDADTVHTSSSSAFIAALSESLLTDDDGPTDVRQHQPQPAADVTAPDEMYDNALPDNRENLLTTLRDEIKEDEDITAKSAMLLKLLESTANGEPMPIVYIEDVEGSSDPTEELGQIPDKRNGRYYRRYPWKRQHAPTRDETYEPDQRYLCVPSRDDVFKLLVGLHDNRRGNQNRSIKFCNRKRPAKVVFTSIRFLG